MADPTSPQTTGAADATKDPGRRPYADPEDLQFGKSAADKEERADQAMAEGDSELVDGDQEAPRPGNKA